MLTGRLLYFNILFGEIVICIGKFYNFLILRTYFSKQQSKNQAATEEERAFEQWKYLLRTKNIKQYDLFANIINHIYGLNATDKQVLSLEQFKKGLAKMNV